MTTVLNNTETKMIKSLFESIFSEASKDNISCDLQSIFGCTNYSTNINPSGVKTIEKRTSVANNVMLTISSDSFEANILICMVLSTNEDVSRPEDIYLLDESLITRIFKPVAQFIYDDYIYNEDPKSHPVVPCSFDLSFACDWQILDLVEVLINDKRDGFVPMLQIATDLLDAEKQNSMNEDAMNFFTNTVKAQALSYIKQA